jgi:hypothetical protein
VPERFNEIAGFSPRGKHFNSPAEVMKQLLASLPQFPAPRREPSSVHPMISILEYHENAGLSGPGVLRTRLALVAMVQE